MAVKASRRGFLAGALAASLVPRLTWADAGGPAMLGAARDAGGNYGLFGLSEQGDVTFRIDLPARGHAAAAHPLRPEAVAFARRPGTFAMVLDCVSGAVLSRLEAPEGHHFMGHGVFVADGDVLLTTENNFAERKGVIGLWDRRRDYARIGSHDVGGIGPHDVQQLSDGRLVVAVGGIFTHPDAGEGREKLNLDTMQPSLTYLDADFAISEVVALDQSLHHNSIRHLAVADDDTVGFAMQWEGDESAAPPLLGLHGAGGMRLAEVPLQEEGRMHNYAGSIAFSGDGQAIAITSPKGGRVQAFDRTGRFLRSFQRSDICGLAPMGRGWIGSDGFGTLVALDPEGAGAGMSLVGRADGLAWDNHLVPLPRLV
ncbi:DUF1513 domain-containing protein [Celeribacter sp.]|uniref:DUF1513 domain-containing protein n=1 Tax=Celeribacter sp. TaxID=1890673 RepID=UPI003A9424CE